MRLKYMSTERKQRKVNSHRMAGPINNTRLRSLSIVLLANWNTSPHFESEGESRRAFTQSPISLRRSAPPAEA